MPKLLIVVGIILIIVGLIWPLILKFGFGHLPGDIIIQRKNFTFYFPITTGLIISVFITVILWLLNKL